jgi:hypothetical protein
MPLRVDRDRVVFQCDGADGQCPRTIFVMQGAMDPPRVFALNGWVYVTSADGETRFYCAEHRRE